MRLVSTLFIDLLFLLFLKWKSGEKEAKLKHFGLSV